MPILFFGVTMTWSQVCDLVSERSFNPENRDVIMLLLRIQVRFNREDVPISTTSGSSNMEYLLAQHRDMSVAKATLAIHTDRMRTAQLQSEQDDINVQPIIAEVFNKAIPLNFDKNDLFDYYLEFLAEFLGMNVVSHGSCCNFNAAEPFVIGYRCDGGYEIRDEASGPVTIPGNDVVIRIRQDFPDAEFMLLSDMCHRCT